MHNDYASHIWLDQYFMHMICKCECENGCENIPLLINNSQAMFLDLLKSNHIYLK